MEKVTRIALVSGGMDSAVLLWLMKPNVKALLFDYGQRHIKELQHAQDLCNAAEVEWALAGVRGITQLIAKGSQTSDVQPPEGHYTEISMKQTIVPNRNSIMLSIAVGWAVATDCNEVVFAAHGGDHTIYPDCRREFVTMFDKAMYLANEWTPVHVMAPFTNKSKADLVSIGHELGVPFELTWSCYVGGAKHCGKCGTCVERREAFTLANVEDPTQYA